jgi:hypothetical protein
MATAPLLAVPVDFIALFSTAKEIFNFFKRLAADIPDLLREGTGSAGVAVAAACQSASRPLISFIVSEAIKHLASFHTHYQQEEHSLCSLPRGNTRAR